MWVGFDDNSQLNLEGAHSALPIWADFMKKALQFREYRDAHEFPVPDGVVSMQIDAATGQPPDMMTTNRRTEYFIAGTEPVSHCPLDQCDGSDTNSTTVSGWDASPTVVPSPNSSRPLTQRPAPQPKQSTDDLLPPPRDARIANDAPQYASNDTGDPPKKKKGFFGKIFGRR